MCLGQRSKVMTRFSSQLSGIRLACRTSLSLRTDAVFLCWPPHLLCCKQVGLRERVATWARACCSLCRWVEPCSNTSLKLFSPWCFWDTQVTSFWRPKPFLKYTYSDWGWKVFHICDPPRMNPPPSCDDWQRLWVKWHTGSLARASQSPEWWISDDHQVKVDISLGAKV